MPKRPSRQQPPPISSWGIFRAAAKAKPLGTVEAADEAEAIEKAAAQFKVLASTLIAVRRR
jgi:hypothetical protein